MNVPAYGCSMDTYTNLQALPDSFHWEIPKSSPRHAVAVPDSGPEMWLAIWFDAKHPFAMTSTCKDYACVWWTTYG